MSTSAIRVLLVDDSPTVRAVLSRILKKTDDVTVVGEAGDGRASVRLARELRPDVILMDIVMPRVGGFEATTQIMATAPTAIMMFSTEVIVEGHRVFDAYGCGACDVMAKPATPEAWTELSHLLPDKIREVARGFRRPDSAKTPAQASAGLDSDLDALMRPIRYLAVGASTGGPEALRELLLGLAPKPPMAILVVQHIAQEFEEGLIDWLAADVGLDMALARQGEVPQPGTVRLAPQGSHLRLEAGGWMRLDTDTPPRRGHRPAADILLTSCAKAVGPQVAGLLLSGMGRDGVEGLQAIQAVGGLTLVQDQASSVVFGMPQAALEAGAADRALCPARLASFILKSCQTGGKS